MGTSPDFKVGDYNKYVEVSLDPDLVISAASLQRAIGLIDARLKPRTNVVFEEVKPNSNRLSGLVLQVPAGDEGKTARLLSDMDLFEELTAEDSVEVEYLHDMRAYLDPNHGLRVEQLLEYSEALRERFFGEYVSVRLEGGQLFYGGRSITSNDDLRKFCNPLYRSTSQICAKTHDGRTQIELCYGEDEDPLKTIGRMEHVLAGSDPVFLDGKVVRLTLNLKPALTNAKVEALWPIAAGYSRMFGVYPVGEFIYRHGDNIRIIYNPPPSNR